MSVLSYSQMSNKLKIFSTYIFFQVAKFCPLSYNTVYLYVLQKRFASDVYQSDTLCYVLYKTAVLSNKAHNKTAHKT
jgi:hypothetical protein